MEGGKDMYTTKEGFDKEKDWNYWPRGKKAEAASVFEGGENLDIQARPQELR